MAKNVVRLSFICMLLATVLSSTTAYCQEKYALNYSLSEELLISTPDMNCNYQSEDIDKIFYNFEYPKLLISDNENPLVIFPDVGSDQLIIAEIASTGTKVFERFSIKDTNTIRKWPMISSEGDKIYLSALRKAADPSDTIFQVLCYDRKTKGVRLQDEKVFKHDGSLWGALLYFDKFMLIGEKGYYCLSELPRYLLKVELPIYRHNYSMFSDNSNSQIAAIEDRGCHNVSSQVYAISLSGEIHAAWRRYTTGIEHDEMVYYSMSRDGSKWIDPIQLYSRKDTKNYKQVNNVSVASTGNTAFVLWQDRGEGIFFSELRDGRITEKVKISDINKIEIEQEQLGGASTIKIASDKDKNVYALWAQNSGHGYELFLKTRISGKWSEEAIINSGGGYLKLPDMQVDTNGAIHITYTKPANPNEVRRTIGVGPYRCYYLKLTLKK